MIRSPQQILTQIQSQNLSSPVQRISWDEKWLAHAYLTSLRSMDTRTKCGCVLVKDNCIISEGYNSFIRNIDDSALPNISGNDDPLLSKYSYFVAHSETNAIINAARTGHQTLGCTAYITSMPCCSCYQHLYQAGVQEIVVASNPVYEASVTQTEEYKEQLDFLKYITNNALPIKTVKCNINIEQS